VISEAANWAERYEVIALEGCDGVGKSTVALRFVSAYGYTLVHSRRTPDGINLAGRYREILARPGKLVLDRSFVSELVYGPLRHGSSRISAAEAAGLASLLAERNGAFVHLTGSPSQIARRLLARDGHAPPLAEIRQLLDAYVSVFAALAGSVSIMTTECPPMD
jgi:hypothetical protein